MNLGPQGAPVMEGNAQPHPIVVPSNAVQELFDTLSALPRLTHCRKCNSELLHVDATFFSYGGETVWNLPLPFCSNCAEREKEAEAA